MTRIGRPFWFRFTVGLAVILVLAWAGLVPWPISRAAVRRSLKNTIAEVVGEQTRDLNLIASRRAAEDAALGRVDPRLKGMYCEFGVWKGTTINYIASKVPGPVDGFDSFEGLPEPLAFGHCDADLYSSTKDVFDALGDRIVTGTILQFDEFFNYPGWRERLQRLVRRGHPE